MITVNELMNYFLDSYEQGLELYDLTTNKTLFKGDYVDLLNDDTLYPLTNLEVQSIDTMYDVTDVITINIDMDDLTAEDKQSITDYLS